MYGYIYKITNNINGKVYIGKHKYNRPVLDENYITSGILINRAIKKYGLDNFSTDIIDTAESLEELNAKEQYWINQTGCQDVNIGYNIAPGGDGGDIFHSLSKEQQDDIKVRCSLASKQKPPLSEDAKRRISQSMMGEHNPMKRPEVARKVSLTLRANNIPAWNKGLTAATDERVRRGHANTCKTKIERYGNVIGPNGNNMTEEHRRKISQRLKGKPKSEEHRKKLSEANKGKTLSQETKQKLHDAAVGDKNPNYGRRKYINIVTLETGYFKIGLEPPDYITMKEYKVKNEK